MPSASSIALQQGCFNQAAPGVPGKRVHRRTYLSASSSPMMVRVPTLRTRLEPTRVDFRVIKTWCARYRRSHRRRECSSRPAMRGGSVRALRFSDAQSSPAFAIAELLRSREMTRVGTGIVGAACALKRHSPRANLRTDARRGIRRALTFTASIRPALTSRLTVLSLTSPSRA